MTYGWAILAVLMIISALAYFGVLNPVNFMPERCTLSAGFGCQDIAVGSDGARIMLQNKLPQSYVITAASIAANGESCSAGMSTALGSGDTAIISIPSCNLTGISGKKRVAINITYHDTGSTFPHQLLGEAITTVSGASYFSAGHALQFNGINEYATAGNVYGGGSLGISFWLWNGRTSCDANNNYRDLLRQAAQGAGTATGFDIVQEQSGGFTFDIGNGTIWTNRLGISPIPFNTWTFMAFSYDDATGLQRVFVNGNQVASRAASPAFSIVAPADNTLRIGQGFNTGCPNGNGYFNGSIDELRISNTPLTLQQVQDEYNAGRGKYGGPAAGLLGAWHFDEGPGNTTAKDYSGNGHDAALVNMNANTAWVQGIVESP